MPFKVAFIFYNNFTAYSWSPAIQALCAYIKAHAGCTTELLHINDRNGLPSEPRIITDILRKSKSDLIAFTSTSFGYSQVNELAGHIKSEFPAVPVILGGVHATLKPEDLSGSNFDGFCIGEGEIPLLKMINALKNKKGYFDTPSFHFKVNGEIIKNPLEPYEKDLNKLPAYDWDVFDTPKLLELRDGWLSLSVSRGCPFNCNFCINHRIKRILGQEGYVRQKTVKRTIGELSDLIRRYRIKVFNFEDDILIFNRAWTEEFLKRYKEEIYDRHKVKFKIEARVDLVTENIIKDLKGAGCQEIQFGVETGNPYLRNFILNKSVTDSHIISAFELCHKYGINTLAFIMLGIPQESERTVKDTIHLLSKIKPYLIRPSFIFPIYGTDFYNYCKENGLLKDKIEKSTTYLWTGGVPIVLEGISEEMLFRYMLLLPWYINLKLGLNEYRKAVDHYEANVELKNKENYNSIFEDVLKQDAQISKKLTGQKVAHYSYLNQELSYLRYISNFN